MQTDTWHRLWVQFFIYTRQNQSPLSCDACSACRTCVRGSLFHHVHGMPCLGFLLCPSSNVSLSDSFWLVPYPLETSRDPQKNVHGLLENVDQPKIQCHWTYTSTQTLLIHALKFNIVPSLWVNTFGFSSHGVVVIIYWVFFFYQVVGFCLWLIRDKKVYNYIFLISIGIWNWFSYMISRIRMNQCRFHNYVTFYMTYSFRFQTSFFSTHKLFTLV